MHKPTVGVDFHFRRFQEGDTSVALQLWDIAGAVALQYCCNIARNCARRGGRARIVSGPPMSSHVLHIMLIVLLLRACVVAMHCELRVSVRVCCCGACAV